MRASRTYGSVRGARHETRGWMAHLRHLGAKVLVGREPPANRKPSMNEITTVG